MCSGPTLPPVFGGSGKEFNKSGGGGNDKLKKSDRLPVVMALLVILQFLVRAAFILGSFRYLSVHLGFIWFSDTDCRILLDSCLPCKSYLTAAYSTHVVLVV